MQLVEAGDVEPVSKRVSQGGGLPPIGEQLGSLAVFCLSAVSVLVPLNESSRVSGTLPDHSGSKEDAPEDLLATYVDMRELHPLVGA